MIPVVLNNSELMAEGQTWTCKLYGCFFDGWCSPATWTGKLPGWRSNL